jgi:SSS family solute:Na+ symporter
MRSFDLVVFLAYLIGTTLFGCWFVLRSRSPEGFMVARRGLPTWAVGLSIFGTFVSSISFLALPGKAYKDNWNPFVFSLSLPVAAWLAVRFFVPFYRASGDISAYTHLERRFGSWARIYAVVCYLLTQIVRMGMIMYLVALALSPLIGWSLPTIILLTGGAVVLYTLVGGMEAVIWTDVIQSVVLIAGAVACVAVLLMGMPEGPSQLFRIASENDKFSLGSFGSSVGTQTFWVVLLYGLTINLQNFGIDQNYVQRYAVAKSERSAAQSVWMGALMYLPVSAVFFFIGTGLFAYYRANPGLLSPNIRADSNAVFPHFIVNQLPPGLTGLVIAAIFAAAQSTLSSSMNSSATLILCDFYRRYFRPGANDRQSMIVLYAASFSIGALGTGMALGLTQIEGAALDIWWKFSGIFSGGMLGLFLLGMISRRAGKPAAITGVILGLLVICWMTFSPQWTGGCEWLRSPFHEFLISVFGTLVIFLTGFLAGLFLRAPDASAAENRSFIDVPESPTEKAGSP